MPRDWESGPRGGPDAGTAGVAESSLCGPLSDLRLNPLAVPASEEGGGEGGGWRPVSESPVLDPQ